MVRACSTLAAGRAAARTQRWCSMRRLSGCRTRHRLAHRIRCVMTIGAGRADNETHTAGVRHTTFGCPGVRVQQTCIRMAKKHNHHSRRNTPLVLLGMHYAKSYCLQSSGVTLITAVDMTERLTLDYHVHKMNSARLDADPMPKISLCATLHENAATPQFCFGLFRRPAHVSWP